MTKNSTASSTNSTVTTNLKGIGNLLANPPPAPPNSSHNKMAVILEDDVEEDTLARYRRQRLAELKACPLHFERAAPTRK